jgi:hypothetical protein
MHDDPIPPNATPELIKFCRTDILPQFPGVSLGDCVSFFLTYGKGVPGFIPAHCKEFLYFDPDAFKLEFTNLGKCVIERNTGPF